MPYIVQLHRLPSSEAETYSGPEGEILGDQGANTIRYQDGATPGGYLLMQGANNLGEVTSAAQSRENIGAAPLDSPNFTTGAEVEGDVIVTETATQTLSGKSFITPTLGASTGTSLALNGATLGSNTLSVAGNTYISGSVSSGSQFLVGSMSLASTQLSVTGFVLTGDTGVGASLTVSGFGTTSVYSPSEILMSGVGAPFEIITPSGTGVALNNGANSWVAASSRAYKKNHEDIVNPIKAIKKYIAGLGHYLEDADDAPKRPFLYYEDAVKAFPAATHFQKAKTLTQDLLVQVDEEHFLDENGEMIKQPVMEIKTFTREIKERKSLSLEQHVPLLIAGMNALIKYIEERDNVDLSNYNR